MAATAVSRSADSEEHWAKRTDQTCPRRQPGFSDHRQPYLGGLDWFSFLCAALARTRVGLSNSLTRGHQIARANSYPDPG
jgi:hypothetical protein